MEHTSYDNKCNEHPNKDIISICENCENKPICIKCITSIEHRFHIFCDLEDETITKPILEEFKELTIPELKSKQFLEKNQINIEKSESKYQKIDTKLQGQLSLITNKFQEFFNIVRMVENDFKRQLITILDENTEIKTISQSKLNNEIDTILKMLKFNEDNNNEIDKNLVKFIKHNYQSSAMLNSNLEYVKYNDPHIYTSSSKYMYQFFFKLRSLKEILGD